MRGGATFSPCGRYRYRLTRRWQAGGRIATWVMLNPSTADAHTSDPTIRRVIGFSIARGFDALIVVNLFALRATDPGLLRTADDPVGRLNPQHLRRAIGEGTAVIAAWGAHPLARLHQDVATKRVLCLGKTKEGAPRHPLYVRGDTPLIQFGGNVGTRRA